jgi:hypothetical protein
MLFLRDMNNPFTEARMCLTLAPIGQIQGR